MKGFSILLLALTLWQLVYTASFGKSIFTNDKKGGFAIILLGCLPVILYFYVVKF